MSKERAKRRAAREHEAALRAAARASDQERRERQAARRRAIRATTGRIRLAPVGRDTGALARRRRTRTTMLVVVLVCLNILVWVVRPDWAARLGALVLTVLAFPVLRLLLFSRR
jgi:hypothetical protein